MMAQPSDHPTTPLFPPFSVIGPEFVAPDPVEFNVEKYPCKSLLITDINHKILLKVKPCDKRFHRQRVLLDANDKPIAMLREKNLTVHSRWNVFRGESKASSDMIFTANTEHMIQFKTNVSVMLANKTSNKDDCDLRIKGSWSEGNCTIYMGDTSTATAQVVFLLFTWFDIVIFAIFMDRPGPAGNTTPPSFGEEFKSPKWGILLVDPRVFVASLYR